MISPKILLRKDKNSINLNQSIKPIKNLQRKMTFFYKIVKKKKRCKINDIVMIIIENKVFMIIQFFCSLQCYLLEELFLLFLRYPADR